MPRESPRKGKTTKKKKKKNQREPMDKDATSLGQLVSCPIGSNEGKARATKMRAHCPMLQLACAIPWPPGQGCGFPQAPPHKLCCRLWLDMVLMTQPWGPTHPLSMFLHISQHTTTGYQAIRPQSPIYQEGALSNTSLHLLFETVNFPLI